MSRVTVVIPTRNRGTLACNAVTSVIAQGIPVTVIVSDNSTNDYDRETLAAFCSSQDQTTVQLLRPAKSLSMTENWKWAMTSAMQRTTSPYFTVLTDRMIFKPGMLHEVLDRAEQYPADVVSYNYDKVEDASSPVHLELEPWTGELLALAATHVLRLSSRGVYSNALPRMLNTMVPRAVLEAIQARFGTVFASISPDVCFAYRCLAVLDRILYYDKAALLQYGIGRSFGINYARGIKVPDVVDFAATLGSAALNFSSAPIPELQTVGNAMFHEYAFVRSEAPSPKFPEIDRWNYLGAMAWDARALRDRRWAADVNRVLKAQGWTDWDNTRWVLQRALPALLHDPGQLWRPIPTRLSRTFASAEEALTYAGQHPRRRSRSLAHHWQVRPKPVETPADGRKGRAGALMPQ